MTTREAPARDPLTGPTGKPPVRSFSIPESLASRFDQHARFLGVSPRALATAVLRLYTTHPDRFGDVIETQRLLSHSRPHRSNAR